MSQGHNRQNAALTLEKFIIRYWERVGGSDVCFKLVRCFHRCYSLTATGEGEGRWVSVAGHN